ncbi:MAG: branched-chain amino acid ABC transporter permease [Luteimonas sp.]
MTLPSWTLLGQSILSGVFIGALYGLLGSGLSLTWGMLREINLAHFALAFLGGYLTYSFAGTTGADPLLALLFVVPGFFAFGAGLRALSARFAMSPFNSLLVSFGLMVILESLMQWIWTADFRRLESHYGALNYQLGSLYAPLPELLTLAAAIVLAVGAWAVLQHTEIGKAMRASSEDAPIAAAFGVNQKLLGLLLAGFSAATAGVAGVFIALSFTLAPAQIYGWIGVVFAAVIIGGLGNPVGVLIAGIVIGVAEAVTMAVTAPSWAPLVSFSMLIAVLLVRPDRLSR